jgi:hypothetical protein
MWCNLHHTVGHCNLFFRLAVLPVLLPGSGLLGGLLSTTFQTVSLLEVTPYIDGTPAGEPLMPNPNRQTEITKKIPAPSPWPASRAEFLKLEMTGQL